MDLQITPGFSLTGKLGTESIPELPGDKSLSHRAALFAALAEGESRIENFQISGVTRVMLKALTDLGVQWQLDGTTLIVEGKGISGLKTPEKPINCGNSATTLRLLSGALAAAGIPVILDGSPGLRRRPMDRVVEPLRLMGVPIESSGLGAAPLILKSRNANKSLKPLTYNLPVASAQVKTCILLAGLASNGPVVLTEPGPSRDHTERLLASMGVDVRTGSMVANNSDTHSEVQIHPEPSKNLTPINIRLPGDISAAAFLIVASLITPNSSLVLPGVGLNPTRTGLVDALSDMGAKFEIGNRELRAGEPVGDLAVRSGELNSTEISGTLVVRMIDEFPIFAVAAAFAEGTSVVRQAQELRHKESDRITALCTELQTLGAQIIEADDGFTVSGRKTISGGTGNSHKDHRLAMSLAVAGLAAERTTRVIDADIISESFPEFVNILTSLGSKIEWMKY